MIVTSVDMRAGWRRALLLIPVACVMVGGWFVVRWHIGNTFAEYPADVETARTAVRLAPDDPQAAFTLARLNERELSPDALIEAERNYARAASLSPNDYRLWMELGRVREAAGDREGGEEALRRAVRLAPAYAAPRWRLGNLLFRRGRIEESLRELKRAGDQDAALRPQIFNLVWRAFDGDVGRVIAAVGESASARAQLIDYLIARERLDDAQALWSSLGDVGRRTEVARAAGENLARTLFGMKRFQAALDVRRGMVEGTGERLPATGQILNGDFEADITAGGAQLFGWQIASIPEAQIHLDSRNGAGGAGRSLRVAFNAPSPFDFSRSISHTVVVAPSSRYRLAYRVRTEELQSVSTLVCEIFDPATNRQLAISAPASSGTSEWATVTLEFTTGAATEGVIVRLVRAPCLDAACPIFGRVWYDDFNLERTGGESQNRLR